MSKQKSALMSHAENELHILCSSAKPDNRPVIEPFVPEVLALMEKFAAQGMSGSEAAFKGQTILEVIKRLMRFMPLGPVTGHKDEWVDQTHANGGVTLFQNNRCPSVFKDLTGAWYVDAVIFVRGKDERFTSSVGAKMHSGGMLTNRQRISFPFKPKTFYVHVYDLKGELHVKDERELKAVFEYYPKATLMIK